MKLLFDQNISFRIVKKVDSIFPGSKQVKEVGLENARDKDIWEFAKNNAFTIVSFDADFADIANIYGCPPKIVWLRGGNMTTNNVVNLLKKHFFIITEFGENAGYEDIACIEIE